jgi:hypothetical protein
MCANEAAIHASCEDFRAAADIDLEMDKADDDAGRKIQCPVHVLWAGKGTRCGMCWRLGVRSALLRCPEGLSIAVTFCKKKGPKISSLNCANF